jgi:hypothetical protein
MGTVLWRVRVFKLAGDTVRLAVKVANADAGAFETGHAFVLRMLYDEATDLDDDYQRRALGPLGSAITEDQIYDDRWLAAHGPEFIKSVELANVVNGETSRESSEAFIEKQLIAEGKKPDDDGWQEQFRERLVKFWRDPKNTPSAVYIIRVTDGKWLAHLKPGQKWDSAAFA